jgi:hypothetical protein
LRNGCFGQDPAENQYEIYFHKGLCAGTGPTSSDRASKHQKSLPPPKAMRKLTLIANHYKMKIFLTGVLPICNHSARAVVRPVANDYETTTDLRMQQS